MLMIVKPLLVEHVVAVLALNAWNCGMTLVLMAGQTCLGQGLQGAARVVAVQSSLRLNESLLVMMFLFIFTTLLIVFGFYIETLYTVMDGGTPRVTLLGTLYPGSRQVALFKVAGHNTIPPLLLSSSRTLPTSRAHTRSCLGSQSLGILERCPRK